MFISFDTAELTPLDMQVLAVVVGGNPPAPAPAKPAKKAAAKAGPKPEPAEAPAPAAEPTPEAEAEAEPETVAEAPTMADAVAAATKLVSGGNAAKVKEALASVGVKRVSEIGDEDIAAFLAALA